MARPLSPPWTLNLEIMKADGPPLSLEECQRTQTCLDFMEGLQWQSREPMSPFDENIRDAQHILERFPSKIRGATLLRLQAVGWTPALLAQTVLLLNNFKPSNMYHWYKCRRHLSSRLEGAAVYAQRAVDAYEDECRFRRLPRRCTNCEIKHQRCSLRDNPKSKGPCLTCKRHGVKDELCTQKYNLYAPTDQKPILEYPPLGFLHREPGPRRRKRSDEAARNSLPLYEDVSRDNRSGDIEMRDSRPTAGGEEHSAAPPEEMDDFAKKRRISERGEFIFTSPRLNTRTQPRIPEEVEGSLSNFRHQGTQTETAQAGPEQVHTRHTMTEQVDTGHAHTEHTGYYPDDNLADTASAEQHFVDSHFRNFSFANLLNTPSPGEGAGSQQPHFGPSNTVNPNGGTASGESSILNKTPSEVPRPAPRFTVINPDPPSRDSGGAAAGSFAAEQPNDGTFSTGAPENGSSVDSPADDGAVDQEATNSHDAANEGQADGGNTQADDNNDFLTWEDFVNMPPDEFDENFGILRDQFQAQDNGPVDNGPVDNGLVENGPFENGPVDNDPVDSDPHDNNAANDDDATINNPSIPDGDSHDWFSYNDFFLMNQSAFENSSEDAWETLMNEYQTQFYRDGLVE